MPRALRRRRAPERLLQPARSLLAQAADLQRLAETAGAPSPGSCGSAATSRWRPCSCQRCLPDCVCDIRNSACDWGRARRTSSSAACARGRFDFALLYDIDLPDDLRVTGLAHIAPHVLLSADHALVGCDAIALTELDGEPLILLDVPPSRDYFTGLLEAAGVAPRIAYSSPSLELVRGLVGRGLGYSLLVTRPFGDTSYDGQRLAVRPIRGDVAQSRIALCSLPPSRPTRAMEAFEAAAVTHFEALFASG